VIPLEAGMSADTPAAIGLAERVELYQHALGFEGLRSDQLREIAHLTVVKRFAKGEIIFHQDDPCRFFHVVAQGLVKVSFCSTSGFRMTYLLADRGEPLNLVGPFTGSPRFLSAEALEDAAVGCVKRDDFLSFALKHPTVVINIMSILGQAIDSANSRIIDMMEKRVEQRLLKVLYTLHKKFGPTLRFASTELAELTGTTTESTLRAMSKLRALGILRSRRGEIDIVDPHQLECLSSETLWV
jgi:CRP-like cAMP-binding protein